MPELVAPTVAVHRSFLAAWDELGPDDSHWMGVRAYAGGDREWTRDQVADPAGFARLVEALEADARPESVMPPDIVHQTMLWYVDGAEWLGRVAIRHRLTPALTELGGHIGYVVRPSARGQGHATRMLAESLPVAAGLGIDPALVTCDTDNVGSRKVIEAAGGELEDERHGKLRFWVPTRTS
ncbi:GNAT family N-acetyltransferase [Kribbella sp. CA-247076]|uniref:GNAT family N-acetyltransferase n=1 Tax=Kribbella sp. CA-247076 TaxID=3239941 RepID=UPI003D91B834